MSAIVTGPNQQPPTGGMGGSIHDWERGLSPWHRDAFPDDLKDFAPEHGRRTEGWFALDAFGNVIGWIPDGTVLNPTIEVFAT